MKIKPTLIFLLAILAMSVTQTAAQDVIYTNDQREIEAKVMEITPELIKYKDYDHLDGPVRNIKKSKVYMIIYENGKRELFKDSEKSEKEPAAPEEEEEDEKKAESLRKPAKQKSDGDETTTSFLLGGKAGYFIPYNEDIQEIYGSGFVWGAYAGLWINRWGIVADFRSYNKEGDPYTFGDTEDASSEITMSTLTLSGLYEFHSADNFKTYGGIGLGITWIDESLSVSGGGTTASTSGSLKKFTLQSTGGMRFNPFYVEITFSSIPVESANFGGIVISGGLLF